MTMVTFSREKIREYQGWERGLEEGIIQDIRHYLCTICAYRTWRTHINFLKKMCLVSQNVELVFTVYGIAASVFVSNLFRLQK